MSQEPVLSVQLSASYRRNQILSDVSFELKQGEVLGLVGTSGAGKSTLVLSLLGLLPWRGGRAVGTVALSGINLLELSERELRKIRGKKIAMIPQSPLSALNSRISLATHFREAWLAHETADTASLRQRTEELMSEVNLPHTAEFMRRRPSEISIGQAQRVLIALALLHRPTVLIADEPTSALDPVTQTQIVSLLKSVASSQRSTMLYISHDLVSTLQLSDRIAVLAHGRLVETLATNSMYEAASEETKSLLATLPVPLEVLLHHQTAARNPASFGLEV